MERGLTAPPQE